VRRRRPRRRTGRHPALELIEPHRYRAAVPVEIDGGRYLPISTTFSICFFCATMYGEIQGKLQQAAELTGRLGRCPVDMTPVARIAKAIDTGDADELLPENVDHQNSLQVL
jgi:hypothetical protein